MVKKDELDLINSDVLQSQQNKQIADEMYRRFLC